MNKKMRERERDLGRKSKEQIIVKEINDMDIMKR